MAQNYFSSLQQKKNLIFLSQWEAKVQRCQKEFDNISAEIKKEMERFELTRARDFKSTIIKYLEDQMAHQQQVRSDFSLIKTKSQKYICFNLQQMKYWEAIVPVAKEIA